MAKNWFRIRHWLRDWTGHQQGLIMAMLGMHRFHGAPPAFTTDSDMLIFKSIPTNPHDRGVVMGYVGRDGVAFLAMIEQERKNDDYFKGFGIWYHKETTGVWFNSIYEGKDPFKSINESTGPRVEHIQHEAKEVAPLVVEMEGYLVEPQGSNQDPEFFEEVINNLDLKRRNEADAARDAQIFKEGFQESHAQLSGRYDLTSTRIGQIIRDIKQRDLGYAGERAFKARNPGLELGGSNTDAPDFMDHQGKRVISFKTYVEPELRDTTIWICKRVGKGEMRYAQENEYSLEMAIYEMSQRRFFRYKFTPKQLEAQAND